MRPFLSLAISSHIYFIFIIISTVFEDRIHLVGYDYDYNSPTFPLLDDSKIREYLRSNLYQYSVLPGALEGSSTDPTELTRTTDVDWRIPKYIWRAVKSSDEIDAETLDNLRQFMTLNYDWRHFVIENVVKDQFMNYIFNGTSILWAYNMINPQLGAAKADIWRCL
jgi:hypothetical protein